MRPDLEDIASDIAYEIVNHGYDKVSDPEKLTNIILEKLKEIDF